ncbi:MAG: MBL fold metallo-hydrolase [Clostridia bacterium]|nr:MBL fold metallo-hydrolase [Clostridia bacterium]
MDVKIYQNGLLQENCYLVYDQDIGVVIDPGGSGNLINDFISKKGLSIKYILLTHGHYDHIGAVKEVKDFTKAQVAIHKNDSKMLTDPSKNLSLYSKVQHDRINPDLMLEEDMVLGCGRFNIVVLHTPGHSLGSCCFVIQKMIFTGDTIFAGSIGRTDFVGGSHESIMDSINNKLLVYDDDYLIYPGHGPSSTIGKEKRQNPFLA